VTSSIHFADILLFPSMPYKLTQQMWAIWGFSTNTHHVSG
jgi:hypothetical protein